MKGDSDCFELVEQDNVSIVNGFNRGMCECWRDLARRWIVRAKDIPVDTSTCNPSRCVVNKPNAQRWWQKS